MRPRGRKCDRGAPNFQKLYYRLTFFRLFWGRPQRNAIFGGAEEREPEQRGDHTPFGGEEEYIYIRSRNGGGGGVPGPDRVIP